MPDIRIAAGGKWVQPKGWRLAVGGKWVEPKQMMVAAGGQWRQAGLNVTKPTITAMSVIPDPAEPYLKFQVTLRTTGVVPLVAVYCNNTLIYWAKDVPDNTVFSWWKPDEQWPKSGQTYQFRVDISYDGQTVIPLGNLTTTAALPIPIAPSGIRVQNLSNTSYRVLWNPVSNLGFYTVIVVPYGIDSTVATPRQQTVLGYEAMFKGTVGSIYDITVGANVWGQIGHNGHYRHTTQLTYTRGWYEIPCMAAATYSSAQDKWRPSDVDLFHGNGGNWTPNHNMQHTSFYYVKNGDPFAGLRGAVERGAVITAAQIRIARKGMGYDKGLPLVVQTHNNKAWPGQDKYPNLNDNKKFTDDKIRPNTTEWITIPTGFARDLVAGRAMGIHVGRDSTVKDYFMNFQNNVNVTGTLRIAIT